MEMNIKNEDMACFACCMYICSAIQLCMPDSRVKTDGKKSCFPAIRISIFVLYFWLNRNGTESFGNGIGYLETGQDTGEGIPPVFSRGVVIHHFR
jgi:hypothetical protein